MARKRTARVRGFRAPATGLWVAAVLVLAAGCGRGGHETTAVAPREAVQAELATASYVPVNDRLEAIGTVDPWVRVAPGTKILGRVASVPVREGERVRAGQVLAALEDADLRAGVDQAKAALTR